jgi:hypothetical protein
MIATLISLSLIAPSESRAQLFSGDTDMVRQLSTLYKGAERIEIIDAYFRKMLSANFAEVDESVFRK